MKLLFIINGIFLIIMVLSFILAKYYHKAIDLIYLIECQKEELMLAHDPIGERLKYRDEIKLKLKEIDEKILKIRKE
jgi:hypothetical protein